MVAILQVHNFDACIVVVVGQLQLIMHTRAHHGRVLQGERDIIIRISNGYTAKSRYMGGIREAQVFKGELATRYLCANIAHQKTANPNP